MASRSGEGAPTAYQAPQAQGRARLADLEGMVDLDGTQIRGSAKLDAACGSLRIVVDAEIPAARGSVILHLLVHACFAGAGTSFDFASMGGP